MKSDLINIFKQIIKKLKITREDNYLFKIKQYTKVIHALEKSKKEIKNLANAEEILSKNFKNPKRILGKVDEYFKTGKIEEAIINKREAIIHNFMKIIQIGPVKAKQIYDEHNIKSIKELKEKKNILTFGQQVGLKYLNVSTRIPREEIKAYESKLKKIITKEEQLVIVGSFRRNALISSDIDILFSSENENAFSKIISKLTSEGLILEHFSYGKRKWLGFAKPEKEIRRVDILFTPKSELPFAMLYFTGSKTLNERMRYIAKTKGMRLNEHGLTNIKTGKLILGIETEEDIFAILKMNYVSPGDRNGSVYERSSLPLNLKIMNKYIK
jgi:DNA polymerase IV